MMGRVIGTVAAGYHTENGETFLGKNCVSDGTDSFMSFTIPDTALQDVYLRCCDGSGQDAYVQEWGGVLNPVTLAHKFPNVFFIDMGASSYAKFALTKHKRDMASGSYPVAHIDHSFYLCTK